MMPNGAGAQLSAAQTSATKPKSRDGNVVVVAATTTSVTVTRVQITSQSASRG
ncbi:hypothetical protein I552_5894 [Mycobacterium xenopi 3993]|nr:hypothetical protein I552_5894 [Mycobacterium xenopi 3993]